jgi:general stress protein 26
MSTHQKTPEELQEQLWKEIKKGHLGMLGLVGDAPIQHFQPMTPFIEPTNGEIYFFTRTDTDLARAVGDGAEAMFIVQSKDHTLQACVGGRLDLRADRERINRYWNAIVAAWYPGGRDDPELTLLRLRARDAQVWLSDHGPLKFALEIARANATHREPDVGQSERLDLRGTSSL